MPQVARVLSGECVATPALPSGRRYPRASWQSGCWDRGSDRLAGWWDISGTSGRAEDTAEGERKNRGKRKSTEEGEQVDADRTDSRRRERYRRPGGLRDVRLETQTLKIQNVQSRRCDGLFSVLEKLVKVNNVRQKLYCKLVKKCPHARRRRHDV